MLAAAAPAFNGTRSPFSGYEQQVSLRPQVTTLEPAGKAAALILQMSDVAQQVCTISGKGHIMHNDGAQQVMELWRDHLAPAAVDAIRQDVVRFMLYKRARGGLTEEFASILGQPRLVFRAT